MLRHDVPPCKSSRIRLSDKIVGVIGISNRNKQRSKTHITGIPIERLKTITTHITPITHRQPTTLTQQQDNHPATRSQPEIGRPRLACLKN